MRTIVLNTNILRKVDRSLCLIVLLLALKTSFIHAQSKKWDRNIRKEGMEILNNSNKTIYFDKKEIPISFFDTLSKLDGEPVVIANPNEKWNPTDAIIINDSHPEVPSRRLKFLIKSNSNFIIVYLHGGRGKHTHIFSYDNEVVKWEITTGRVDTIDDLKNVFSKKNHFHTTYYEGNESDFCF